MNAEFATFAILAVIAIAAALGMLFSRSAVYSALFLVLNFGTVAVFYILLNAPFIAMAQVSVYAGAIMVLFLFVIMLLDIKASERRKFRVLGVLGGIIVAGTFVWELAIILRRPVSPLTSGGDELRGGLEQVVKPLFAHYMLPFEVTALLLLVAMIGVVLLSKKELK